jgi:hypothetical protein
MAHSNERPLTHDRHPTDPFAVGRAVSIWLSHYSPESRGESETTDDEADIALERVLLDQGVLSPADSAYFEHEAAGHRLVHVILEDGTIFEVTTAGTVQDVA